MKLPKPPEPLKVPFEPLVIQRRSYRPDRMTAEQQRAMSAAGQAVLTAYLPLLEAMRAALRTQSDNAGSYCTSTVQGCSDIHRNVQLFIQDLNVNADPKTEFPKLPQIC